MLLKESEQTICSPTVITETIDGMKEPYEQLEVEVDEDYMSSVVDSLRWHKVEIINMPGTNSENMSSAKYTISMRRFLRVKNALLTATRGTSVMNSEVIGYKPFVGYL